MALFSSSKMLKNRKWEVGNGNESHEDAYSALSVLEKIQAGVHLHIRNRWQQGQLILNYRC